jgi:hypothetical protein
MNGDRKSIDKALNALARHIEEQEKNPVCLHVREAYDVLDKAYHNALHKPKPKVYIVIETLDGEPTVNKVTIEEREARIRLYDLAVANEVVKPSKKELAKALSGRVIAYSDSDMDHADAYRVDLLEWKGDIGLNTFPDSQAV